MKSNLITISSVLIITLFVAASTSYAQSRITNSGNTEAGIAFPSDSATPFSVGAAKVDITPPEENLTGRYNSVHDRLFCRAVVIDNGTTSAALVSIDQIAVSSAIFDKVTSQIEKELEIPALNIFISPSHTHSGFMGNNPDAEKGLVEVVRQAKAKLQPARISYNTGLSYINVNRDVINPVTRLWSQGPNYEGPSDKTVAVIQFTDPNGEPIAVYYNYAMHANTMMFMRGAISADFPGETSKYIEEYYDNKIVALFSSGAAGDQNPLYFMAPGKVPARMAQMIASLGQLLGEEVLRVMRLPQRYHSTVRIYASQQTVTCPGRKRTDRKREGAAGTYEDGDPVNIKLSLLRLGDIALAGVNAEVYNIIAQRLKKESPLNNTIFASITNGNAYSGYIPSDDAFQRYTFQVLGSRLKPNCAERSIIDGLLDMIEESE